MDPRLTHLLNGPGAERRLVEGLLRGEESSYRQLYEAFSPRLRALLLRIHRDAALVDDTLQATFLKVFRHIAQFSGQASLRAWVTRIAIHEGSRLSQLQRRSGLASAALALEPVGEAPSPEQRSARAEEYACLAAALAALPLEKRTALLLFEVEGFSVQEIADITAEPRGTVLARLSRTRAELRQAVEQWRATGRLPAPAAQRSRG